MPPYTYCGRTYYGVHLLWQVVPYSPTEDLPVQMFSTSSCLPPLPPPSNRLRVSLMDAACASRGELQMHHIPFFFKVHMHMHMRMHGVSSV